MALDQLLFTAAPKGLHGLSGFQIVAASPRLASRHATQTKEAVRLCNYDLPNGRAVADAPVSFGWLDSGGWRYAFQRVYVGKDPWGRPGNFAAHVLVGDPRALPVPSLARSYRSPFWWRGDEARLGPPETRGELPQVELAQVARGPIVPPPQHLFAHSLAALLTAPARQVVVLRMESDEVAAVFAAIARLMPELLDGEAVSTFEAPGTAARFRLIGCPLNAEAPRGNALHIEPGQASHVDPQIRSLAHALTAEDPEARKLATAALAAARQRTGKADFRSLQSAMQALTSIGAGTWTPAMRSVLNVPAVREFLGEQEQRRSAVVGAAFDGEQQAWASLAASLGKEKHGEEWLRSLANVLREQIQIHDRAGMLSQMLSGITFAMDPERAVPLLLKAMNIADRGPGSWSDEARLEVLLGVADRCPDDYRLRVLSALAADRQLRNHPLLQKAVAETIAASVLRRLGQNKMCLLDPGEQLLLDRCRGGAIELWRRLTTRSHSISRPYLNQDIREFLRLILSFGPDYPRSSDAWLELLIDQIMRSFSLSDRGEIFRCVEALELCAAATGSTRDTAKLILQRALQAPPQRAETFKLIALAFLIRAVEAEQLPVKRGKIEDGNLQEQAQILNSLLERNERDWFKAAALKFPERGKKWERTLH